ncbi:YveK family protein [Litchfieldia salsa]|uniref:YveK family protein n=1 Tax=Litchfieldia salsa TaxID=930152 RepID=UPI00158758F5|nr:Wzz/FepE/Etk N-terminal domain-containing protein [Litchfieldia salsa]
MEKEINLKKIVSVIKHRIWMIIVLSFLAALAGGIYNQYTYVPIYEASTRTLVKADDNLFAQLTALIKEPNILEKVVSELDLPGSAASLGSKITINQSSQVLVISVVDIDPARAANIANTVTEVFIKDAAVHYDFTDFEIFTSAEENPWPINPKSNKLLIVGFILGAGIGIGLIFLLDSLDDTTRNSRDTEEILGIPVLGKISKMTKKNTNMKMKKQKSLSIRGESIGS